MELIDLQKRLKTAIKTAGGNKKVSELSNIPLGTINNYLRGVSEPTFAKIIDIAEVCNVSTDWLASGKNAQKNVNLSVMDNEEIILVPMYDAEASAGIGLENTSQELATNHFAFDRGWLVQRGVNPNTASIITTRGDSMEPTIKNNDILLVDHSIKEVSDDGIYIIIINNATYVKRIQFKINGSIALISDNPLYDKEIIPYDDIHHLQIAGRVMWFGRDI